MSETAATGQAATQKHRTGYYIYAIAPADVATTAEARGVGDPPAGVEVIAHDDIAALVSEIPADHALGTPDDFAAHARLVDAAAQEVPILPLRFGAVLPDREAVTEELLAANHDEFADALQHLDGRAEFIVKGRYDEQAILREVLAENRTAEQLRAAIAGAPEDATRNERIQLGELMTQAVAAKREQDTAALVKALAPLGYDGVIREPTHERDAVYVAYLVDTDGRDRFRETVEDWAERQRGRIDVRLLGPVAAYDFVGTAQPGS
ncbi:GvpL/GvpF family gas vesicle protein [Actinocrinis puniceicyclus]|uniref:GvpL/GvpF family gas vesicle protein n=1 Tax=Actinocrinis puniceicyclus TaxID=977794 RepID=A0A8J7WRP0_9ACTN|nr:GvpL/GvpF family gas vesicle protein [Actinocrinis puniceicyclus]MBS2964934.1 GvpL/GvpF family gas vesicle protein [Actinocrinis puniceicyclus]